MVIPGRTGSIVAPPALAGDEPPDALNRDGSPEALVRDMLREAESQLGEIVEFIAADSEALRFASATHCTIPSVFLPSVLASAISAKT